MASIEKRTRSDGSIGYRVVWRDPQSKSKKSMTFDDHTKADRFARLLEQCGHRLDRATKIASDLDRQTPKLAEIIDHHIHHLTGVQQRTREDYARDSKNHIIPHLGSIPIDEIEVDHIRWWVNKLDGTLSVKTLKNLHSLLSAALESSIPKYIDSNPAKRVRLPRSNPRESTFLTREEFQILLEHIPEYHQPMIQTLAMTGLRWGEMAALEVGDIELMVDIPYLRVTKAVKRDKGGFFVGPPKSVRSRRTVSLPRSLVDILVPYVATRNPSEILFTGKQGRRLRAGHFIPRIWIPAVESAQSSHDAIGNPIPKSHRLLKRPRIHDLRHSHASWLIAAGVDLATVQRRLGHESITTTVDRYGHLTPGQMETAAQAADLSIPENVNSDQPSAPVDM